ncbi:hypothetical protein [Paraburkholderia xenovorans]|uniref:hypothetical protein n=1 Tax=Paraburkholderia xenovorans TaxID=36873 RepID=UPI0038BBAEC4
MDPAAIKRRREMRELSMFEPVVVWATSSPGLLTQHLVFAIYSTPLLKSPRAAAGGITVVA